MATAQEEWSSNNPEEDFSVYSFNGTFKWRLKNGRVASFDPAEQSINTQFNWKFWRDIPRCQNVEPECSNN